MKFLFHELSMGDTFFVDERNQKIEWLKVDDFHAVTTDGSDFRSFDPFQDVNTVRYRQHILDLRQGDIVQMVQNIGIIFQATLVLKVVDNDQYRKIKFARPMVRGSSFATTCPSGYIYLETYEVTIPIGDRSNDNFYHVIGIDEIALYESCSYMLNADHFRMATFLQANGDEREMSVILCEEYCHTREKVAEIILNLIKNRKDIDFPERNDANESLYEFSLENRDRFDDDLSPYEARYLKLCSLRKS